MNAWNYRLLAGVMAGLLAGVVVAQTSTPSSSATTDQGAPPAMQKPTGAGDGSRPAARMSHSGQAKTKHAKTKHATHHASKSRDRAEQTAMTDEKQYRDALRQCVKEQEQALRDSCLDEAIEHYHRNG